MVLAFDMNTHSGNILKPTTAVRTFIRGRQFEHPIRPGRIASSHQTRLTMNRLFLFLLAGFVLIGSSVHAQDSGAEAILNVLAKRPHDVSLVVYSLDDPESGLYHNANVMRPLATTIKILVLAEYGRRVADGMLDPEELVPLDSVETYYFTGTDRGAHVLAVTALGNAGHLENDELTLAEIAEAMIRFNDNAAADYLMVRFGREAMDALPERLDLLYAEPPVPISGIYLTWDTVYTPEDDPAISYDQPDDRAWMFSQRLRAGENFSDGAGEWMVGESPRLSYGALTSAALSFPTGSARAYAGLMARVFRGELISEQVSEIMLDILDYEMDDPGIQVQFDQLLATRSGSLAGILTGAYAADLKPQYVDGHDPPPTVVALFVENLTDDVFDQLMSTTLLDFEMSLLNDPEFVDLTRERLGE